MANKPDDEDSSSDEENEEEWDPESYEDFSEFPAQKQSNADKTCAKPWESMLIWDDEDNEMDFAVQLQSQNLEEKSVDLEKTENDPGQDEDKPADNCAAPQPEERVQQLNGTSMEKKTSENPQKISLRFPISNKGNVKIIEARVIVKVSSVYESKAAQTLNGEAPKNDQGTNLAQEEEAIVTDSKPKAKMREKKKKKKKNKKHFM